MNKLLVATVIVLLLAPALAQGDWIKETVASLGDQGTHASIAMDADDKAHVAWFDATNAQLKYAVREFDGWYVETVETGQVGQYTSVAVNPVTQYPAIAYYDFNNERPRYAWYDGASWTSETIEEDEKDRGRYIHLEFNSNGIPYVAYKFDGGLWHTNGVRVGWKSGASWSFHTLEDIANSTGAEMLGEHTAITFDAQDYPQIAYRREWVIYQNLYFGWQNGSGWHTEECLGLDISGEYNDIALDGNDNVYVSFFDYDTFGDDCVSVAHKDYQGWWKENVECVGSDWGKYTSIAVDDGAHLHVTYIGDGDLRYANTTPGYWFIQRIDSSSHYTGIVLDSSDRPWISYYETTARDMKVAYELPSPTIISIDPDTGMNTGVLEDVEILGNYFMFGSAMRLYRDDVDAQIPGVIVTHNSKTAMVVDLDLTDAPTGYWDVEVTNAAGTGKLVDGFFVNAPGPQLDQLDPAQGPNDDSAFGVTINGRYFQAGMTVRLERLGETAITASTVNVADSGEADVVFNLLNAATGFWDVVVETPFGDVTLEDAFEVVCGTTIADFSANPTSGFAALMVDFTDLSAEFNTCEIDTWDWDFGDGNTSADQNPTNTYSAPGLYTVSLTVYSPGGDPTETKVDYIEVKLDSDDDVDDDVDDDADDDLNDDVDDDVNDDADDDVNDDLNDDEDDDWVNDDTDDDTSVDDNLYGDDDEESGGSLSGGQDTSDGGCGCGC